MIHLLYYIVIQEISMLLGIIYMYIHLHTYLEFQVCSHNVNLYDLRTLLYSDTRDFDAFRYHIYICMYVIYM
jgi:hypothetical protein